MGHPCPFPRPELLYTLTLTRLLYLHQSIVQRGSPQCLESGQGQAVPFGQGLLARFPGCQQPPTSRGLGTAKSDQWLLPLANPCATFPPRYCTVLVHCVRGKITATFYHQRRRLLPFQPCQAAWTSHIFSQVGPSRAKSSQAEHGLTFVLDEQSISNRVRNTSSEYCDGKRL